MNYSVQRQVFAFSLLEDAPEMTYKFFLELKLNFKFSRLTNSDTQGQAQPRLQGLLAFQYGHHIGKRENRREGSALVNIRRKALSPLMIFTQGRTVFCLYVTLR